MVRLVAVACCVACIAVLAVEASADRRAGVDRRSGFSFELQGTSLTVGVRPGQSADEARAQVFGEVVDAICTSSYEFRPGSRVVQRMTWPEAQDELTFVFGRDISETAKACLLESEGGGDIAAVTFGPAAASLFVQTDIVEGQARPGVRSFLRLRDGKGRTMILERGRELSRLVEPGRYRLIRYERRCRGSCRVLGSPILRCARRLWLPAGLTRSALVLVDYRRQTCRIEVTPDRVDTEASVKRTIRAAVRSAVVEGNFARACRFGTRAGRRRLLEGYNSSNGPDFRNCEAILRSEVRDYPDVARRLRRGVVISDLRIRGRTARARVADGHGRFAGSGHVSLRRVQGRWRIDNSDLIPYGD